MSPISKQVTVCYRNFEFFRVVVMKCTECLLRAVGEQEALRALRGGSGRRFCKFDQCGKWTGGWVLFFFFFPDEKKFQFKKMKR